MAANPACEQYLSSLSPFVDGELLPPERVVLERHLAVCPRCTGHVADLRAEVGM